MGRKRTEWEARRAVIQRLVDADLTDAEIGAEIGLDGWAVRRVRKLLGIASAFKQGQRRPVVPPRAPDPVATYTDESGRTVTVYPTLYADGAFTQGCTARPRTRG
jgi:hypothetical protein